MNYPALLSFFCGFVSLSIEILWVRLYGFAMLSTPAAFGFVLMAYLTGIALGAWWGGKACRAAGSRDALWRRAAQALGLSALVTLSAPFCFAWVQGHWWHHPVLDFALIGGAASILAYAFPIAHHLGAGPGSGQQGRRFATVYTSNVLGATLGPLVTGYLLLNLLTLQQSFTLLAVLQGGVMAMLFALYGSGRMGRLMRAGGLASGLILAVAAWVVGPHKLIQQLNSTGQEALQVVENRQGIITIFAPQDLQRHEEGDHAVFGGNVYDGRTNLSLQRNTNGLDRGLMLAALQPQPKRVLMVGMSIGSWLALVNGFPGVEQVDVIEINPGYMQAVKSYPAQASAMADPRVNLVIDDARRWLKLNPAKKYDLVIMNTTLHWRANSSFLLSTEYLQLIKQHMAPEAVMVFNATGSADAFYTATRVFDHAYRFSNFVYAAGFDFRSRMDSPQARQIYESIEVGGAPIFAPGDPLIEQYLGRRFTDIEVVQKVIGRPLEEITDNNAVPEFRYGRRLRSLY